MLVYLNECAIWFAVNRSIPSFTALNKANLNCKSTFYACADVLKHCIAASYYLHKKSRTISVSIDFSSMPFSLLLSQQDFIIN